MKKGVYSMLGGGGEGDLSNFNKKVEWTPKRGKFWKFWQIEKKRRFHLSNQSKSDVFHKKKEP